MLHLKPTVVLDGLHPAMALAATIVEAVFSRYADSEFGEVWITSANDSEHAVRSNHYQGRAMDFRIKNIHVNQRSVAVDGVRLRLGPRFLVLWEDLGLPNEHMHVEYTG